MLVVSLPVQQTVRETEIEVCILTGPGGSACLKGPCGQVKAQTERGKTWGTWLCGHMPPTFGTHASWVEHFLFCFHFAMEGFYYCVSSFLNSFFFLILF